MADREHTKQPVEETRPTPAEVEADPEDRPSRPEQPDFDPSERRQYDDPPVEVSLADADEPEDR